MKRYSFSSSLFNLDMLDKSKTVMDENSHACWKMFIQILLLWGGPDLMAQKIVKMNSNDGTDLFNIKDLLLWF